MADDHVQLDEVDLGALLSKSAGRIPTIEVPKRVAKLLWRHSKTLEAQSPTENAQSKSLIATCMILAFLPAILQFSLYHGLHFSQRIGPWNADFWNVYYCCIILLGLIGPRVTWYKMISYAPEIVGLLNTPENIESLKAWILKLFNHGRQFWFLPIGGILSDAGLFAIRKSISHNVRLDSISYVTIFIVGAIALSSFYWVMALTFMVHKITSMKGLSLTWFDPAHSEGVAEVSRLLGMVFAFTMLGDGLISLSVLEAETGLANGPSRLLMYTLLAFGTTSLVFVGVAPQFWLSSLIQQHRRKALVNLGSMVGEEPVLQLSQGNLRKLEIYRDVLQLGSTTIRTETVVGYVASAIAGFAPLLIDIVAHH